MLSLSNNSKNENSDFVFMYVHKPLLVNTENALINYTTDGGSLSVLHHGIASAKMENPKWLDFSGFC